MADTTITHDHENQPSGQWIPSRALALKIALSYALLGAAWIFFSDNLLYFLVRDPELLILGENLKGWFFVGITGLLLWLALDRYFGRARRSVEKLRDSEARLQLMGDNLPESYIYQLQHKPDGMDRFIYVSAGAARVHGVPVAEILRDADLLFRQIDPEQRAALATATEQSIRSLGEFMMELRITRADGERRILLVRSTPRRNAEGEMLWDGFAFDITEKRKAERDYQTLFREMLEGFALHEILCNDQGRPVDYRFLTVNPAFERMTGLKAEDILGRTVREVLPGIEANWIDAYGRVALTGEPVIFENYVRPMNKHFEVTAFRPAPGQFACIFSDITTRKLAEAERERLAEQLRQAVKMEAIGNLAGGVAHDFNNMLGVILGYAEMSKAELPAGHALHGNLVEIEKAANHSRDITRQLLAFSRRQIVSPRIVDPNRLITALGKTMTRLIGEDIDVEFALQPDLWKIKIDPAQVDQILINLVVNARDAMPRGGKLTVETANVVLDNAYGENHFDCRPGDYVLFAVSDNGTGMDREIQGRIFDPFFTTKGVGGGTGLGLSTVYGIVKQNGGYINVYSEPGRGTTFKIYLPGRKEASEAEAVSASVPVPSAEATVLLVEDDDLLRQMTKTMLERIGHKVLVAGLPQEAIALCRDRDVGIDLVLTDVVMPGMSGKTLKEELAAIRPDLKVLFMSGYTSNVIAHHGVLDEGVHFIQKPFRKEELARKIDEVRGCLVEESAKS